MVWVHRDWTLAALHLALFSHFRMIFHFWYQMTTMKRLEHPFIITDPDTGKQMQWKEFMDNGITRQHEILFPLLNTDSWKQLQKESPQQCPLPYSLQFKDISGYNQDCFFCDEKFCGGACPVPYTDELTVGSILSRAGLEDNNNFYHGHALKDIQVQMTWS